METGLVVEKDQKIVDAIVTLLESDVGYGIDLFSGLLSLYQLEDGRFAVNRQEPDIATGRDILVYEEVFEDARSAAEFYERKRCEHQIGYDIEREPNRE